MAADTVERRLTTILAADVVGYSRLMAADEAGTLAALKGLRQTLVQPLADRFGGRIIKLMGDGMLMEFGSVVAAVDFSVQMQQVLREENTGKDEDRTLVYRIGINIGDIIVDGEDIYGDGVNVAARLEPLAAPGEICISAAVHDQILGKVDYAFEDLGDVEVKNMVRPIRVYRIVPDNTVASGAPARPVSQHGQSRSRAWQVAALVLAGGLAIAAGVWWWTGVSEDQSQQQQAQDTPVEVDRPSIAVLPFLNRSDDPGQDYFTDGLTDDLITDLSKVSGLFVISRNTVFTFKDKPRRVSDVAQELGVRFVLEGSVRRGGDRVRVNAQLIEGKTGQHVWAERYDRKLTDLFAVQDELVSRIVSALAVKLTQADQSKLAARPAPKFEAYDLYLKARQGFFSRDQDRMRESLTLFAKAWTIDPTFARAYAGYAQLAADMWRLSSLRFAIGGATARKAAEVAARKALQLDPTVADAYSVLALIRMVEKDHAEAIKLATRAVELDPNSSDAHTALAIVQGYAGRPADALASMKTAIRLNPKPPPYHLTYYGWALFLNGMYAEAIEVLKKVSGEQIRSLGDAPHEILAMAYAMIGKTDEAREQVRALHADEPFLNLAYYRVIYQHHARKQDLDLRIEALRRAGMPAWPFDFRTDGRPRVAETALRDLIGTKTWSGHDTSRQSSFIQEMGAGDNVSYAAARTLLNGTAVARDGELCERFEGFILGKDLCGPVFENPDGSDQNKNRYIYVNPSTVLYFSVDG